MKGDDLTESAKEALLSSSSGHSEFRAATVCDSSSRMIVDPPTVKPSAERGRLLVIEYSKRYYQPWSVMSYGRLGTMRTRSDVFEVCPSSMFLKTRSPTISWVSYTNDVPRSRKTPIRIKTRYGNRDFAVEGLSLIHI
eukprot:6960091-Alexandrium_andersonii.AAC.1